MGTNSKDPDLEDETFQVHQSSFNDVRLNILNNDSIYCDTDNINEVPHFFNSSKYCALHLNIHSLPSKFDELQLLINDLKNNGICLHFILLCETFLNTNNADRFHIPGYSFLYQNRTNSNRGGIGLYLSNEFNFKERPDLCINDEGEFESLLVEIDAKDGKRNLIVGEIYRVPGTNEKSSIDKYDQI